MTPFLTSAQGFFKRILCVHDRPGFPRGKAPAEKIALLHKLRVFVTATCRYQLIINMFLGYQTCHRVGQKLRQLQTMNEAKPVQKSAARFS